MLRLSDLVVVVGVVGLGVFAAGARAAPVTPPVIEGTPPAVVHPLSDDDARALGTVAVELLLTVGVDGAVAGIELQRSSGAAAVDAAAVEWARALHFTPATSDGHPVSVRVPLTLTYAPPPVPAASRAAASAEAHADHSHAATDGRPGVDVAPHAHEPVEPSPSSATPSASPAPSPASPASPAPPVDAGTTSVRHRRAAPPPTTTSDVRIEIGALADVPRRTAGELLALAPGVLLQNHGGEGHPESLFLRGFDAGEGQDVELSVEGVPLNAVSGAHGHGFADTNVVPALLVEELHVVQGPFDPRQGDFAVAGSADYALGRDHPGLEARVGVGQWDTARVDVAWSPAARPDAFVGAHLGRTGGFGPARAAQSGSLGGGVTLHLDDNLDLRVLALASSATFAQPGPVRVDDVAAGRMPCAADADAQFFCAYDDRQGGTLQRALGSATLLYRLGRVTLEQQAFAVVGKSRMIENFTGALLDPVELGGSQRGDAAEFVDARTTVGGRTRGRWRFELLDQLSDLELGGFARHDAADVGAFRLRTVDGAPYRTIFDRAVDVTNLAAWAAVRLQLLPFLTVSGGLRADSFSFVVDDENRPALDREGTRLTRQGAEAWGGALQPRATTAWRLWQRDEVGTLSWQTSVGVGIRSSDAAALSDGEAAPFSDVRAAETGLAWSSRHALPEGYGSLAVEARAAAFSTAVTRDLVFDEQTARNVDVGASLRLGSWAQARARWGERLDVQTTVAWTEAFLVGATPPPPSEALKLVDGSTPRLPYVPRLLTRFDGAWRESFVVAGEHVGTSLALGAVYVAPRPIPLEQFAEPIFVVDSGLRARWSIWELGVTATNLLDARYQQAAFNYVSNFRGADRPPSLVAANHFVAGAPRTVLVELGLHIDGI